ncbi:hypothetical protein HX870_24545 [Pseudomonas gingeri]|uniref:hypothetical protein n=1 Tax=Pseudomonas gingeri TaxID=117681 RepID=UPI00159FF197|nr:hypothetical protein [Pseudomonas gingeri]NWD70772.1 hypothetical protein [Pseudomonas gingeri]
MPFEIFENVPREIWGLAGVIFGSLLTAFSAWLTNRSNTQRLAMQLQHEERVNNQKIKKERMEELYILVSAWALEFNFQWTYLKLAMEGVIKPHEFHEKMIERERSVVDYNRISMIVDFYGGEVEPLRDFVIEKMNQVNMNRYKYESFPKDRAEDSAIRAAGIAYFELEKACDAFKAAIAGVARKN